MLLQQPVCSGTYLLCIMNTKMMVAPLFTRERRMSVAAAAFIFRLKKPQLLRGVHQVLQVWGGLCKKFLGFLQEYLELYQRELVKGAEARGNTLQR